MPVAFVTGGTGFVGTNLIEELLSEKWEVVALHRSTSDLTHLRDRDIRLVEGSITEPDSLMAALPDKVDAVMINPANIIGHFDFHGWSQLFILIDRQKLPGVPPASHSFCHVREVARVHIAAYYKGKKGNNYLLGGADPDFITLAGEIGRILGKPTPQRTTPAWLLRTVGRLSHWASYITRKEPDLTPEKAFLVTHNELCSSQKAERELGYKAASLQSMLEECYQWMRSEGLIGLD